MNQPKSRLILNPETGKPIYGVGAGTVGAFLSAYYPEAKKLIRIASAYFTVEGYNIGLTYLPPESKAKFQILVGPNEGDRPQLAILNEVEKELKGCKGNYAPIVRDLVHRIENNEFIILDAREMEVRYHCKFYVCDQRVLVHGSGNYTGYGIESQHEQAGVIRDAESITESIDWFNEAAATAKDLTLPLLTVLREWLNLADPFHAYLKFLAALDLFFDRQNVPGLLLPVYYQQRVIARAVDQIEGYRAAVILAATGLGKTIIGAELAFQLKRLQVIDDIIVIAPSGVHTEWKKHLKARGFYEEPFGNNLLFASPSDHAYYKVYSLDDRLSEGTDRTLIIIDEAHVFRNQDRSDWQKHDKPYRDEKKRAEMRGGVALDRIRPLVNGKKAKIVLLTATPYGTNPKNIESLLKFLPETLPKKEATALAQPQPFTLDEFATLPFTSSLGLQQVLALARSRDDIANGRVFVQFGNQRRYMPETVYLRSIEYQLPFFEQLCDAFDRGLFAQNTLNITDGYDEKKGKYVQRGVDTAQSQFITSWLSSPVATAECLTKNLHTLSHRDQQAQEPSPELFPDYQRYTPEDIAAFPGTADQKEYGYEISMKEDWKLRDKQLRSLEEKLTKLPRDNKVAQLLALLRTHAVSNKEKVIVFVERHTTAIFVAEFLQRVIPGLPVGCTVARKGDNGYILKDRGPRNEILDNFSPISREPKKIAFPVQVLICTDANGIGINLQDANVVVNYDPADSADILFQRAGRIIRFTENPHRSIYVYTLKPVFHNPLSTACRKIAHVFENMSKHHGRSKRTFGLSLLPETHEEIIDLNDPKQETDFVRSFNVAKDSGLIDPLFRHTAVFDKNRELAATVKDNLYASMVYKEKEARVAVLVEQENRKHVLLYNLTTHRFEHENDPAGIIELIACKPETQNAPVDFDTVERVTKLAINKWLGQSQTTGEPNVICGFYLAPRSTRTFTRELLRAFVQGRKKHRDKMRKPKRRK